MFESTPDNQADPRNRIVSLDAWHLSKITSSPRPQDKELVREMERATQNIREKLANLKDQQDQFQQIGSSVSYHEDLTLAALSQINLARSTADLQYSEMEISYSLDQLRSIASWKLVWQDFLAVPDAPSSAAS